MPNLAKKTYEQKLPFKIALDGPSASGKGHIGKLIAQEFNLHYVCSSKIYRGLAYLVLQKNINPNDETLALKLALEVDILAQTKDADLAPEEIAAVASIISSYGSVRIRLTNYLKNLIKTTPRIIMEGRDIGTKVAPDADLKIFMTASLEVRAKRRLKELQLAGKKYMLNDILKLLAERDQRDQERKFAPLVKSEDAFFIDNTQLAPEEVILKIKNYINEQ